jgi:hypothetical protein
MLLLYFNIVIHNEDLKLEFYFSLGSLSIYYRS